MIKIMIANQNNLGQGDTVAILISDRSGISTGVYWWYILRNFDGKDEQSSTMVSVQSSGPTNSTRGETAATV